LKVNLKAGVDQILKHSYFLLRINLNEISSNCYCLYQRKIQSTN